MRWLPRAGGASVLRLARGFWGRAGKESPSSRPARYSAASRPSWLLGVACCTVALRRLRLAASVGAAASASMAPPAATAGAFVHVVARHAVAGGRVKGARLSVTAEAAGYIAGSTGRFGGFWGLEPVMTRDALFCGSIFSLHFAIAAARTKSAGPKRRRKVSKCETESIELLI